MSIDYLQFRENIRVNLEKRLTEFISEETIGGVDVAKMSRNVEKGIYNYCIKEATTHQIIKSWTNTYFMQLYVDRFKSVYLNINEELVSLIISKEIPAHSISFMSHQEFRPEKWKELIEKKMKRDESRTNQHIEASTTMYSCKKCKSKRCTYYEMQTRSADEPATIFLSCLDCGKNWKV